MTSKKSLRFIRTEIKTDLLFEGPIHSLASLEVTGSFQTLITVHRTSSVLRRVQSYWLSLCCFMPVKFAHIIHN